MSERHPAAALVRALRGRTVIDGSCDGEGMDDVRLRLDDGSFIALDVTAVHEVVCGWDLGFHGRLIVTIGGAELWPFDVDDGAS